MCPHEFDVAFYGVSGKMRLLACQWLATPALELSKALQKTLSQNRANRVKVFGFNRVHATCHLL